VSSFRSQLPVRLRVPCTHKSYEGVFRGCVQRVVVVRRSKGGDGGGGVTSRRESRGENKNAWFDAAFFAAAH
jgi:hypothetical protein